ncbi:hypothetical protein CN692_25755 [Bacillus sp. AFS002410]|uniref:hypothetical protein n=1 Tax=Bacillus sp. AFS002410 TaxID=2033481 RepID=UPI000BEF8F1F|nr:hypothetical protein [Bacillus sp. AFS002410]PEJ46707.1 hypothetical protein CN692_25755 [Bacillus sp. AFS002410]
MKKPYIILIIVTVFAMFLAGFYYERMHIKSNKEIWIGYNYTKFGKNEISFKPMYIERQSGINQLEEIFLYSKIIDHPTVDLAKYDIQLSFKSPVDQSFEYSSLLWFTKSGAILKLNGFNGFRSVNIDNAESIKKIIKYTEF